MAAPAYDTADMTPAGLVFTTVVSDEAHVRVRPVSAFPSASTMLIDGDCSAPGSSRTLSKANETRETGTGITAIAAEPVFPSLDAEMVTVDGLPPRFIPAATTPVALTVAMVLSEDAHEISRPVSALPLLSSVAADRVVVAPLATVIAVGETETDATAAGSVGLEQERSAQAMAGINR